MPVGVIGVKYGHPWRKTANDPSADLKGVSWIAQRYTFDDQRNIQEPVFFDGS
jgi:hypothetical protein